MTDGDAGWAPLGSAAGVRAWGPTRASALAQAAQGVLALVVKPEQVAEREHREVRAQGQSPEQLLSKIDEPRLATSLFRWLFGARHMQDFQ